LEDHDALAILQHYGWPTPSLDLTGTLEVALFFALEGKPLADLGVVPSVLFVVDTEAIKKNHPELKIVDHSFLVFDIDATGTLVRWLRQDGYAIIPIVWFDNQAMKTLDLKAPGLTDAVTVLTFHPSSADLRGLEYMRSYLLSIVGDPIPSRLQANLQAFCNATFGEEFPLSLRLRQLIENIVGWPVWANRFTPWE